MGANSNDNSEQPTRPEVPDGWGVYQPGDIIDLGSSELKDKHGRPTMTFKFEGVVAGGSVAERLRHGQAAAIRDVLTYLATRNTGNQSPSTEEK